MTTRKPLRILSIDDDRGCQLAAARFFTLVGGHMVEAAGNGSEGIKKAAELRPDMILLDMGLPDMDGLAVLESLASAPDTRTIPVIILTGTDINAETERKLSFTRNFLCVEQKPVKFAELLNRIEAELCPQPEPAGLDESSLQAFPRPESGLGDPA